MIEIRQVNKRFRRHHVLKDVTFDVDTGDRIALVGSNGAGKTTLIRCLLGEYDHEGVISINGRAGTRARHWAWNRAAPARATPASPNAARGRTAGSGVRRA